MSGNGENAQMFKKMFRFISLWSWNQITSDFLSERRLNYMIHYHNSCIN